MADWLTVIVTVTDDDGSGRYISVEGTNQAAIHADSDAVVVCMKARERAMTDALSAQCGKLVSAVVKKLCPAK